MQLFSLTTGLELGHVAAAARPGLHSRSSAQRSVRHATRPPLRRVYRLGMARFVRIVSI